MEIWKYFTTLATCTGTAVVTSFSWKYILINKFEGSYTTNRGQECAIRRQELHMSPHDSTGAIKGGE